MIDKITDSTKVRYWIERINEIIDKINATNYSWDTTSVEGKPEYKFNTSEENSIPLPVGGEYIVYYAGVELHPDDYTVNGDTLTFTEAPKESGCSIRVRFLK